MAAPLVQCVRPRSPSAVSARCSTPSDRKAREACIAIAAMPFCSQFRQVSSSLLDIELVMHFWQVPYSQLVCASIEKGASTSGRKCIRLCVSARDHRDVGRGVLSTVTAHQLCRNQSGRQACLPASWGFDERSDDHPLRGNPGCFAGGDFWSQIGAEAGRLGTCKVRIPWHLVDHRGCDRRGGWLGPEQPCVGGRYRVTGRRRAGRVSLALPSFVNLHGGQPEGNGLAR